MTAWYEFVAFAVLVVAVAMVLGRHFLGIGRSGYEEGETLADEGGVEIVELTLDGHVRRVGIAVHDDDIRVVAILKPREARHLAQALRIACAPGINLSQARFNAKRRVPVA